MSERRINLTEAVPELPKLVEAARIRREPAALVKDLRSIFLRFFREAVW